MKLFFILMVLFSFNSFAAKIECISMDVKFLVESKSPTELKVTYRGETVAADGILENGEVDLVARFRINGEATLFAKIGRQASENYLFVQGKRFPVICK